jgi:hypothetical protein
LAFSGRVGNKDASSTGLSRRPQRSMIRLNGPLSKLGFSQIGPQLALVSAVTRLASCSLHSRFAKITARP